MIVSDYSKVEEQERSWHRRHAVWRARKAGATFTDIGRAIGISGGRVAEIYRRADDETRGNQRSPLARELSRVEFVDRSQILNAERARVPRIERLRLGELAKRDRKISRLQTRIAELESEVDSYRQYAHAQSVELANHGLKITTRARAAQLRNRLSEGAEELVRRIDPGLLGEAQPSDAP